MKCAGCFKPVKDQNSIKCSRGKYFCSLCINILAIATDMKKSWKCPDCNALSKKGGDNSMTPVQGGKDSQNVTHRRKQDPTVELGTSEVKELISEVRLLTQEISSLKQRLEEATLSLTSCHVRLDELAAAVTTNDSRIKIIEDREKEVAVLKTTVEHLQRDLNSQAQAHLRNEVEISGIPENKNENLYHIVLLAARKIGVELVDNDIDFVTRVGARAAVSNPAEVHGTPRPIVARLMRRSKRDLILKASKSRKNVMSSDLEIPGPSRKVYYNERLTRENRLLFREARNRSKLHGYAYCWSNQGAIYVRQREGKAAMLIPSRSNLDNIFGAHCANSQADM